MDVVCALIYKRGKLLGTRRGPSSARAGKWEFPGGKVMKGEAPESAIVREIMEELDMLVKVNKRLPEVVHQYPEVRIRLIPFICSPVEGDIKLTDHDQYEWIPENRLASYDWSEADKSLIQLISGSNRNNDGYIV